MYLHRIESHDCNVKMYQKAISSGAEMQIFILVAGLMEFLFTPTIDG
jgi:hypothetical protein